MVIDVLFLMGWGNTLEQKGVILKSLRRSEEYLQEDLPPVFLSTEVLKTAYVQVFLLLKLCFLIFLLCFQYFIVSAAKCPCSLLPAY